MNERRVLWIRKYIQIQDMDRTSQTASPNGGELYNNLLPIFSSNFNYR